MEGYADIFLRGEVGGKDLEGGDYDTELIVGGQLGVYAESVGESGGKGTREVCGGGTLEGGTEGGDVMEDAVLQIRDVRY